MFDGWTQQDFLKLQNKNEIAALAKILVQTSNNYKFNGYVLEVWSQIVQVLQFKSLVTLIKELGKINLIIIMF